MTLSEFLCVVVLFLLIISKTILSYDGIQIKDGSHGDHVATTDNLSKESHLQQWSDQSVSPPSCPERCSCKRNATHHIINVNCCSRGLTTVPDLPPTTVVLSLENNSISKITCDSFKHLRSLQDLSLASNIISHLLPCVFLSQSGSLLNLNISDNNIDYLDVKLFRDMSQLKTLDLSFNIITHLAKRTFSDLAQLVHLNLSFNFIDTIASDAFQGLRSLKTLSLLNNRLDNDTSFHRDVFQDLVALETLDVKANEGRLDSAICSLRNLSHVYMDLDYKTAAEGLGTGYRQLFNLQVFDVSYATFIIGGRYKQSSLCHMPTLPSKFFDNIRTEKSFELYLSGCQIQNIENNTFHALPTLVTLNLRNNRLINFAKEGQSWMSSLINTTITSLDLSVTRNSKDSYFIQDSWFQDLAKTNLKTLLLYGNRILQIHAFLHFPCTIETLDVGQNGIMLEHLYMSFLFLFNPDLKLRELRASYQRVGPLTKRRSISMEIPDQNLSSGYTHFKKVAGAGVTSLSSELSDNEWPNDSQILHISSNKTVTSYHAGKEKNKPVDVWNVNSECLHTQQHSNVTLICLPAYLETIFAASALFPNRMTVPHIRILHNTVLSIVALTDNLLTSWLGPVENVPSLAFLDLSRNSCDNVDVNFFKYMVGLQTLILNENSIGPSLAADITGITFSTLTNLTLLDVSQNTVQDLSRLAFINNKNLKTLNLSYNRLTEFQPTLSTIRNMSFLDVSRNLLPGLSEQTCDELKLLKSRNKNFAINLLGNPLLFTCDYLPFLGLLISNPNIFFMTKYLKFRYINGTNFYYKDLDHQFSSLAKECLIQRYFIIILIIFFIVVGTLTICAVIYHKRWKLRYLYYIGHRRMHIGEHVVEYLPAADVFITYDQDDLRWRRFMQQTFLPGLNQRDITYILGEVDFPGGDLMAHVTGAVVGTRKTVVLLSVDICDNHHREIEMNLAIMREMDTRSLKIIPIFVEEVDLALYPREIEIFLRNQWQRCLRYSDSDEFWDGFVDAVRENN